MQMRWYNNTILVYKNTNVYMDTFKNAPIWYMMIWYDMIWYDNAICHGIWYEIWYMWYEIWCDMRPYDVAYEWYGMVWCYIHCWEKGEIGCHTPYLSIFAHSVCCVCVCVCLVVVGWVGVGCLRRCMDTLGPLIFSSATTGGCLNNPISYSGKYAACWAYFMRHHGLRPTAVSHPFSSLHISLCLAGVNHYQRITILRIVFQKLAIPGAFFVFFLLSFPLTFVWLVCYCSLRLYFSPGNYS